MNAHKIQYFEKSDVEKYREYIDSQCNCVLCGSVLELRHVCSQEQGQIKEEAYCPSCEIRTRAKIFPVN